MAAMRRHSLVVFFFLAYLLSWLVWGTQLIEANGQLAFHLPDAFAFIGLSLAAVVTAALTGGTAAVMDLVRRMGRWRVRPIWYAVALLIMIPPCFAAIALHQALGGTVELGTLLPLSGVPSFFIFHALLFLVTEETAWRGFALPRLQHRYSALSASLILGLLWGVWHAPLFLMPDSFQAASPFPVFVLSAVATTILMTWVFNHTRGSVLVAAVFHAATDAAITYFNVMTSDLRLSWLFVGILWLVALILVVVEGRSHLTHSQDVAGTVTGPTESAA